MWLVFLQQSIAAKTEPMQSVLMMESPKERTSHESFQWSIDEVRRYFRLSGQDIFRDDFRRSRWFYAWTGFWVIVIIFEIITVLDYEHCYGVKRYLCITVIDGATQVRWWCTIDTLDVWEFSISFLFLLTSDFHQIPFDTQIDTIGWHHANCWLYLRGKFSIDGQILQHL